MEESTDERLRHISKMLNELERKTSLEAIALVSKSGLRVACATNTVVDADLFSASAAALINIGAKTAHELGHGNLNDVILRGENGFTIVTEVTPQTMLVASCKETHKLGYYMALLKNYTKRIAQILSMPITEEKAPIVPEEPVIEERPAPPSIPVPPPEQKPPEPKPLVTRPSERDEEEEALLEALRALEEE
nr:roadblock/LC7 domain-containing protein [Candidatus Baldrarchaeota archaeon]